jgi:predicted permease
VISAAETVIVPLSQSGWNDNIDVAGGAQRVDVNFNRVSDGYFRTLEIPLLRGRNFNDGDSPKSPAVAVVNETFVRKLSSNADPIGRMFRMSAKPDQNYQVIGVVKDTKYYELREDPVPIVYFSFTQANGPEESSTLMIRSNESLRSLISGLKHAANDMNPSMVLNFSALKPQIREGLLRERLMATLSGFFGAVAAILAAVGLYGVISYMVACRRSEIGVRLALGANRVDILQMILGEAATLLALGLAVGTGLAMALGRAAASMLYGMTPRDPFTLVAAIATMAVIGLAASLWPAQRAATLHPMACLREE